LLNILNVAGGFLALEFALGTRAGRGLSARPVALSLFAERRAGGFGSDTGGVALGRGTNGLALRAVILLAHVLGATNGALGLLAVHLALGAF